MLEFDERSGGNRFDLRDNEIRPLGGDQFAQGGGVGHVDDPRAVRHLLPRGILVTVYGGDFDAQTLQGDNNFFAEFPGA